jgi:Zn-dependent M28 family amino/carboxypeptidase
MSLLFAITASALLGHVSFLSSDLLEGRKTPSRGLDVAAEYIAAHFRGSGLQPILHGPESDPNAGRNVIAILRGSDPKLRNSYVMLSAHYDHVGVNPDCTGDCIYNGANDNASGVASVLEIAAELAAMKPAPKRSVIFVLFYGEELGLDGSKFYVSNPAVPLADTVAMLNLEQLGRTDDPRGTQLRRAALTGFAYSEVSSILSRTAARLGVEIYDPPKTEEYFERSDNAPLAEAGVPAHTLVVAAEFPDYHAVTDEWKKLDYANMAVITRAVAAGIVALANSPTAPKWFTRPGESPEVSGAEGGSSPAILSPSQPKRSARRPRGSAAARSDNRSSKTSAPAPAKSRSQAASP